MGCKGRKARYLSEINTVAELREARRELEFKEWYLGQRLAEDASEVFSIGNLLSMIAPSGSLGGRIIGGVGTGIAAVQAIMGTVGSLRGRKAAGSRTPERRSVKPRSSVRKGRSPEIEVEVELEGKKTPKRRR